MRALRIGDALFPREPLGVLLRRELVIGVIAEIADRLASRRHRDIAAMRSVDAERPVDMDDLAEERRGIEQIGVDAIAIEIFAPGQKFAGVSAIEGVAAHRRRGIIAMGRQKGPVAFGEQWSLGPVPVRVGVQVQAIVQAGHAGRPGRDHLRAGVGVKIIVRVETDDDLALRSLQPCYQRLRLAAVAFEERARPRAG